MALVMNQAPVTSSAASLAVTIPGGLVTVLLSNPTGGNPIYVGTSNAVTAANGFFIPAGAAPVTFTTGASAAGTPLWAISTGAGTAHLSYLISTTH